MLDGFVNGEEFSVVGWPFVLREVSGRRRVRGGVGGGVGGGSSARRAQ